MLIDKVVIRYKDNTVLKGRTSDFASDKATFHVRLLNGKVEEVQIEDLKAVFYVENFVGDSNYICRYKDCIQWGGHKIKVEFFDGEVIVGYIPYYPKGKTNFLMTPADLKSNNKMVYVVHSAIKQIYYL